MSEFVIECEKDGKITTLTLDMSLVFKKWKCEGGAAVWGNVSQGSLLPPVNGDLDLSDTAIINNWEDVEVGSTGKGLKVQDTGSFPHTEFSWECITKS